LFFWPEHSPLTVISVDVSDPTLPLLTIAERGARAPEASMPGGLLSLSINGSRASTALLWATIPSGDGQDALTHSNVPGTLRVFAAGEVARELWSSDGPERAFLSDRLGRFAKNAPPLVADGRVYVATHSNTLAVYGLMNWATLITHSTNAPRSLNLGRPFTDLVSVQNTGDRGWKSGSDRLQVRFVTLDGAVAAASEVPLSRDIPWNGILQFDVSVPTPTAIGVYQVSSQMLNGSGVPFGENMNLGTLQMH